MTQICTIFKFVTAISAVVAVCRRALIESTNDHRNDQHHGADIAATIIAIHHGCNAAKHRPAYDHRMMVWWGALTVRTVP